MNKDKVIYIKNNEDFYKKISEDVAYKNFTFFILPGFYDTKGFFIPNNVKEV